jgi:hypothetical protein
MRWVLPRRCDEPWECLNVIAREEGPTHVLLTDYEIHPFAHKKVSNMLDNTRELSMLVSSKGLRPQIHYHLAKRWQIVMQVLHGG